MYRLMTIFSVLMLLSVEVGAEERMVRINAQNDTLVMNDQGNWVPASEIPYVLEPIEVWEYRDPGPGDCFVLEDLFISKTGSTGWKMCELGGDWQPIDEPTLAIIIEGALGLGDFISTDTNHKVKAEITNIPLVEEWRGFARECTYLS